MKSNTTNPKIKTPQRVYVTLDATGAITADNSLKTARTFKNDDEIVATYELVERKVSTKPITKRTAKVVTKTRATKGTTPTFAYAN